MSANRGLDLESVNKNKMVSLNLHCLLKKSAHRERAIERLREELLSGERGKKASSYHRREVLSLLQSISLGSVNRFKSDYVLWYGRLRISYSMRGYFFNKSSTIG